MRRQLHSKTLLVAPILWVAFVVIAQAAPSVVRVSCTNPPGAKYFVPWFQIQALSAASTTTVLDEWRAWRGTSGSPVGLGELQLDLDDPAHAVWGQKYRLIDLHGPDIVFGSDFFAEPTKGVAPPATRFTIPNPSVADTIEVYGGIVTGSAAGGDRLIFAVTAFPPERGAVRARAGVDVRTGTSANTYVTGCNGNWITLVP